MKIVGNGRSLVIGVLAFMVAVCALARDASSLAAAGAQSASAAPLQAGASEASLRRHFTDLPLITQDGRAVRFFSDLLKDRIVLVNFVFTSCSGSCPVLSQTFSEIQGLLGERLGRDVHLISVSVDPLTDTPAVLKRYSENFAARPGWTFLTGKRENIDWVIYKLGQYNEEIEAHSPLILMGDVRAGRWRALIGSTPPQVVMAELQKLLKR